jgi:methylated-DNA-[protein]-cysteine S-methyltransferase
MTIPAMTETRTPAVLYTIVPSPIDPLLLTGDGEGITGLYLSPHTGRAQPLDSWRRDDSAFDEAAAQLAAFFAGRRTSFDLSLRPHGTPFQEQVWQALLGIPYGETVSYGELARRVGNVGASRAVGLANGRNPISIMIPCHRVIGADGRLTGYGGGLDRKRFLLDLERGASRLC